MEEKTILLLYKDNSKFYKATGKDALILNYLCDYKIINNKVGFPDNTINKVLDILDENEISYQIIYVDKNPKVCNYMNNKYSEVLDYAYGKKEKDDLIVKITDMLNKLSIDEIERIMKKIERV